MEFGTQKMCHIRVTDLFSQHLYENKMKVIKLYCFCHVLNNMFFSYEGKAYNIKGVVAFQDPLLCSSISFFCSPLSIPENQSEKMRKKVVSNIYQYKKLPFCQSISEL
jgi:hypothetical protein